MASDTQTAGTGRAPENLLTLQYDGSGVDVFFITDKEHTIVLANSAFARCCNLAPQQIAGHKCYEIIHHTPSPPAFCPFANGAPHTSPQNVNFYSKTMGGDFNFLISPLINTDGVAVSCLHGARAAENNRPGKETLPESNLDRHALCDHHDSPVPAGTSHLTDEFPRKAAGISINNVQDDLLIQLNRLAVISELLRGITHQWKQPLNTISLLVQSLQLAFTANQLAEEEMNTNADDILTRLRLVSEAISDFSGYLRWDDAPESVFIHEEIIRAVNMTATFIKSKGIKLVLSVEQRVTAQGNANELVQAVINILLICRECITTQRTEPPLISVTCFESSGRAIVVIRDNCREPFTNSGQMPLAPYANTLEHFACPAIGITIAKLIIEKRLGGLLTTTSSGNGTEFRIELGNTA